MAKPTEVWMPFYVGDYLGDTQRLTTEQHGAYLLLILDYWRNGPPPDDDAILSQITRLNAESWAAHKPSLKRMFRVDGGVWNHARIEAELVKASANQERRSDRAKRAADARWNAASNASSMPQAMPGECSSPSPSPSPSPEPIGSSSVAKATSPRERSKLADKPDDVPDEVWRDFQRLRKEKRAPLTDTALAQIRNQATRAGWSMEQALTECCARGWQGFKAEWIERDARNGNRNSDANGDSRSYGSTVAAAIAFAREP